MIHNYPQKVHFSENIEFDDEKINFDDEGELEDEYQR
jgi:hypothetical protein